MSIDKFGRHSSSQVYFEPGASVRYVANNFLRRDGSNDLEGDIVMNSNRITSLADPVNDQDASTKAYADTKLNSSGGPMSGNLDMNSNKITDVDHPTDPRDAVNKHYVDESVGIKLEEQTITSINQAHGIPSQQPDNNWYEFYDPPTDNRDGVQVVSKTLAGQTKDVIKVFYYLDARSAGGVGIRYRNPDAVLAEMKAGFTIEIKDFAFTESNRSQAFIYIGNGVKEYQISLLLIPNDHLIVDGRSVGNKNQFRNIKIEASADFGLAKIYADDAYLTSTRARDSSQKRIQFFGSFPMRANVNHEIFFSEIVIKAPIPTGGGKRIVNVADPIHTTDVVNKRFLENNFLQKPVINIWAQQKGALNAGQYEWSFGAGDTSSPSGYFMPSSGRIIRGVISSVNGQNASDLCLVNIVIEGVANSQLLIKAPGSSSSIITFNPPIELTSYARINFQTQISTVATDSMVSLFIELDI